MKKNPVKDFIFFIEVADEKNFCYHQALRVNKKQAVKIERYSEK